MIQLVHHHLYHHHHHYLLNHSVRPHMFGWSLVLPCMQRGHSFDLRIESSVKSLCKGNSAVEQSDARPVSLLNPHSSNLLSLPPRSKDQVESCSQCLPCCSHARFPMSVNRGSPPVSPVIIHLNTFYNFFIHCLPCCSQLLITGFPCLSTVGHPLCHLL